MSSDLSDDKPNEHTTTDQCDYNADEYDGSDEVFKNNSVIENKMESNENVEQLSNENDSIKTQSKQIPKIEITDNDGKASSADSQISWSYSQKDIHRYLSVIVNNGPANQPVDLYDPIAEGPSAPVEHEVSDTVNATVDCFIPPNEKVELLRKFSAPIPDDQNQIIDKFLIQKQYRTTPVFPSDSYDIRTKLNDRFKCNVCHNAFNDPRVLDCLHEFCFECLQGLHESNKRENSDADGGEKVLNG